MSKTDEPVRGAALTEPPWRDVLCDALVLAEHAVAGYYAIQPREWASRFRYDVVSAHEHPHLDFAPGTLAQIVRMDTGAAGPPRYRIVLRDDHVLARRQVAALSHVLAYTLAHELVHLVRFASGLAPFEVPEAERDPEEERVRRIASEALVRVLGPSAEAELERLTRD
ncbi:MAG: hypothetical protein KBD01_15580 [Acidobacteria bacterium]|nr:hypothetical protein [Acidobacteriota bacterium]